MSRVKLSQAQEPGPSKKLSFFWIWMGLIFIFNSVRAAIGGGGDFSLSENSLSWTGVMIVLLLVGLAGLDFWLRGTSFPTGVVSSAKRRRFGFLGFWGERSRGPGWGWGRLMTGEKVGFCAVKGLIAGLLWSPWPWWICLKGRGRRPCCCSRDWGSRGVSRGVNRGVTSCSRFPVLRK